MMNSFSLMVLFAVAGILLLLLGRKSHRKLPQIAGAVLVLAGLLLSLATFLLATAARNH
ncbi:MAG: hypothetical protein IJS96_03205 [Schwartzia sp.]|nr:hypothetical protein [Schwartzia sp. (in: firmicutes)]